MDDLSTSTFNRARNIRVIIVCIAMAVISNKWIVDPTQAAMFRALASISIVSTWTAGLPVPVVW